MLNAGGAYIATVPNRRNLLSHVATLMPVKKRARFVSVKSRAGDLQTLSQLIQGGSIKPVLERTYPLEQAALAHAYIETKRARGKVVMIVGE